MGWKLIRGTPDEKRGMMVFTITPLSAPCRNRTYNLMIKSHLLCQLS